MFGLIEEARISRKSFDGRMRDIEITLSEWVYRSVVSKNVLTLHRDYFRLRKPIERRMYEIARKHCGQQSEWSIGLELLQKKCGASSPLNVFRALVRKICAHDDEHQHFPDYAVSIDRDLVRFRNRSAVLIEASANDDEKPYIDAEQLNEARAFAPGYDIYALYEEWSSWWRDMEKPPLKILHLLFLGSARRNLKAGLCDRIARLDVSPRQMEMLAVASVGDHELKARRERRDRLDQEPVCGQPGLGYFGREIAGAGSGTGAVRGRGPRLPSPVEEAPRRSGFRRRPDHHRGYLQSVVR